MAINWAKKLQQVERINANLPEGDDWFTSEDFRENSNIGITRAHKVIKELIKEGKIKVHRGSAWNSTQKQLTRKIWYKFV
jgi:hypothetical protein